MANCDALLDGVGAEMEEMDLDVEEEFFEEEALPKKPKKAKKHVWKASTIDDFIDIVVTNDKYKKYLIFENARFQKNTEIYEKVLKDLVDRLKSRDETSSLTVNQLRTKFKKCVGECKKVACTVKTGTGLNRFIDDKGYSAWFRQLFEVVKTRDSCQPERAHEPSAPPRDDEQNDENQNDENQNDQTERPLRPASITPPPNKRRRGNPAVAEILGVVKSIATMTEQMMDKMTDEAEKDRAHDMELMKQWAAIISPPQQPPPIPAPAPPPQHTYQPYMQYNPMITPPRQTIMNMHQPAMNMPQQSTAFDPTAWDIPVHRSPLPTPPRQSPIQLESQTPTCQSPNPTYYNM